MVRISRYRRSPVVALAVVILAATSSGVALYLGVRDLEQRDVLVRAAQAARANVAIAALAGAPTAARLAEEREAIRALGVAGTGPVIADQAAAVRRRDVARLRIDDADLAARLDLVARAADATALRSTRLIVLSAGAAICLAVGGFLLYVRSGVLAEREVRRQELLATSRGRALATVQRALLNRELPAAPALGLHGRYVPAASEMRVGGDWYDVVRLPDRRVFFSIGDVAGHGLEAAVYMDTARQAILAAALHENDPAAILSRANDAMMAAAAPMVTAICGFVDPAVGDVVYATAGHPPPLLVDNDATRFLPYDGLPLGVLDGAAYEAFAQRVRVGALLVLYTDGLIEHKRDIIGGQERLLAAAREAFGAPDPASAIERFVFGGRTPADDVAILTVVMRDDGDDDGATVGAVRVDRLPPL